MEKIHMTIFAVAFVIIMMAWPMTLRTVAAMGPSGLSYSYETFVNNGGSNGLDFPMYGECEHTDNDASDDMMVGIGVYAFYDTNANYAYNYGNWWFSTQVGAYYSATVDFMPPMEETLDLDYGLPTADRYVTYDYSSGQWLNGYWYYVHGNWEWTYFNINNHNDYRLYVGDQWNWNFGSSSSAAGTVMGSFYWLGDPNTVDFHYAMTQAFSGHSVPEGIDSYAFLTAHSINTLNLDGNGDW